MCGSAGRDKAVLEKKFRNSNQGAPLPDNSDSEGKRGEREREEGWGWEEREKGRGEGRGGERGGGMLTH